MRFRFVHAADLHLDTPFVGVGRVAPRVREALREASLEAFDALTRLAIEEDAAFLLLAGDIFDGPERGVRAQLRLKRGLESLAAAGIRSFIAHGNHDPHGGWSAVGSWPPGVHVFGTAAVERVDVERHGRLVAAVYGISHSRREVRENLARRFERGPGDGLHVGVLHCHIGGGTAARPHSPCAVADLCASGLDYWALGHLHRPQIVRHGQPWIVYPGTLQGRSPRPPERGPRGAWIVEVEDGRILSVEFRALDRVRFLALNHDLAGDADLAALRLRLAARAEACRRANSGRGLVLRVVLRGSGPARELLGREGALEELLGDLRDGAADAAPVLWWESLQLETTDVPRASPAAGDDLSGELFRTVRELSAHPEESAALLREALAPLRRAAVSRWVAAPASEAELLAAAQQHLATLLREEDAC